MHEQNRDANPDQGQVFHVDSDWKSRARAEKEKLTRESGRGGPKAGAPGSAAPGQPSRGGPGELPPANITALVSELATRALAGLGQMEHPESGRPELDLEMARYAIDMLGVVQEKTRGNLSPQEDALLEDTVYQLRMVFVRVRDAAVRQAAGGVRAPGPGPGIGGQIPR